MRFRTFRLVHSDVPAPADGGEHRKSSQPDQPLFDAYSQAVVDIVESVGPAVVRVETSPDRS